MCRFSAYIGYEEIFLSEVIEKPVNSLVRQSKMAREGITQINADGFGIGWYSENRETPVLFKSIQPAWNERNLHDLARIVPSRCFITHVRASSVGDVTVSNCHPFRYLDHLFAHNGTIKDFDLIKHILVKELPTENFLSIRGQTDSEHLFALIESYFRNDIPFLEAAKSAIIQAIAKINQLKISLDIDSNSRLNLILTNGKEMLVTRYCWPNKDDAISLYYTAADLIKSNNGFITNNEDPSIKKYRAILVASEPLTDFREEWFNIPSNSMLSVDRNMNFNIVDI